MPDTATKWETVTPESPLPEPVLPRPRGRHRKPRRRPVLFAVGGLALAAGALSVLRVAGPHPSGGGENVEATDLAPSGAGSIENTAQDGTGAAAGSGAGKGPGTGSGPGSGSGPGEAGAGPVAAGAPAASA
ncbi:hypothetical protein KUF83_13400, partial [Streptomyces sp. BV286]|nr:hypothetical protein [Streptomyces sp. BV286]